MKPAPAKRSSLNRHRPPSGFTLIEMLVVIAILAVLISIFIPAVNQARMAVSRTQCKNNLMQIGLALGNYQMSHNVLPPGTQDAEGPIASKESGGYHMGWMVQILPYIEEQNVHSKVDFGASVYDPVNAPVRLNSIKVFSCPSDNYPITSPKAALTSYCGVHNDFETPIDVNQNGVLFLNSAIRYEDVRDGSSNTIYVMETQRGPNSDLGWLAGTRSSLRNAVVLNPQSSPNQTGVSELSEKFLYQRHKYVDRRKTTPLTRAEADFAEGDGDQFKVGGGSSHHMGGMHVLMGDGAVRFILDSISVSVLRNLAHRADGELPDTER